MELLGGVLNSLDSIYLLPRVVPPDFAYQAGKKICFIYFNNLATNIAKFTKKFEIIIQIV